MPRRMCNCQAVIGIRHLWSRTLISVCPLWNPWLACCCTPCCVLLSHAPTILGSVSIWGPRSVILCPKQLANTPRCLWREFCGVIILCDISEYMDLRWASAGLRITAFIYHLIYIWRRFLYNHHISRFCCRELYMAMTDDIASCTHEVVYLRDCGMPGSLVGREFSQKLARKDVGTVLACPWWSRSDI